VPLSQLPAASPEELAALELDYRYGASRLLRQRSLIVLLAYDLDTQAAIARTVRCSLDTIQRTLARYRQGGRAALRPHAHPSPPNRKLDPTFQQALARAMEQGPAACGVPRPTWTAPLLAAYLQEAAGVAVSERTVRRGLAALGYVCRRPVWTVRHRAEEQADYLPKGRGSRHS
jgi:transposase